jgi:glucokinase
MARSQRPTLLTGILADKGSLTPEDLHHAAELGDQPAQEIWQEVGLWLGRGLTSWVEIFAPEVILIGGGVAQAGHWLIDPMEREMRRTGEPYFVGRVREVKRGLLGKSLAMLGAASLFLFPGHEPRYGF